MSKSSTKDWPGNPLTRQTKGERVTVLVPKLIHRELKMKALQCELTVQEAVHQALVLWMKAK